jgi:hypothetical protein
MTNRDIGMMPCNSIWKNVPIYFSRVGRNRKKSVPDVPVKTIVVFVNIVNVFVINSYVIQTNVFVVIVRIVPCRQRFLTALQRLLPLFQRRMRHRHCRGSHAPLSHPARVYVRKAKNASRRCDHYCFFFGRCL